MFRNIFVFILISLMIAACGKDAAEEKPTTSTKKSPAKSSAYQALESVDDGGTVSGTVLYKGGDADASVKISKDQTTCDPSGKGNRTAGSLIVADGKLKNAVVFLSDIKKGKSFDAQDVTVDNVECKFTPHVTVARKGDTLIARNSDPVLHNANMVIRKGSKRRPWENVPLPQKDSTVKKPVKKTGLVDIKCDAHEWMQGYLYVTDHPYAVVTDATGAFSLSDVPAGDYTLKAWHEKLGFKSQKITVKAGDSAAQDLTYE